MKLRSRSARELVRLRFTDEWVGVLVLAAIGLFAAAVIEAGVLRDWLRPTDTLYLTLPQTGTDGLSLGADVEVLGIHAGTIARVKLNPNGALYAVAEIDPDARDFIRHDSAAVIRRRFVVAGATYVDISRGHGSAMNWHYAVIAATTEPNPADTITATLADIRAKTLPTLDHAEHLMASLDAIASGIEAGHGTAGVLLTDDTLARRAEDAVAMLRTAIGRLAPIEGEARATLGEAHGAAAHLNAALAEIAQAAPRIQSIARNTDDATANLPALLTQAQITASELGKLADALRHSWLLGGGGGDKPQNRLPPDQVRP